MWKSTQKLTGRKWVDFLICLPAQTTVHLRRLLEKFPNHRFRKQINEELDKRQD